MTKTLYQEALKTLVKLGLIENVSVTSNISISCRRVKKFIALSCWPMRLRHGTPTA